MNRLRFHVLALFGVAVVVTGVTALAESERQLGTASSTVSQTYPNAADSDLAPARFRQVLVDYQFVRCAEPKAFREKLPTVKLAGTTTTEWYSSSAHTDLTAAIIVHHGDSHQAYFTLIVSPEKPDLPEVVWKSGAPIYQAAAASLPPSAGPSNPAR